MPGRQDRHRVVVFGDQETWESCEGRGPRVVELSPADYALVQEGDGKSVFQRVPGVAVTDLLRQLRTVKVTHPRAPTPSPLSDDIDPAAPLFDAADFGVDDEGRFRPTTIGKVVALSRSLNVWAGADVEMDDYAPCPAVPECVWWPRPRGWTPPRDPRGPHVRVGIGHRGGLPRFEAPTLYIKASWPAGDAVRRLIGDFGPVARPARTAEATARAMALTRMARAAGLPERGPSWWLRRVNTSDPDRYMETTFYHPAIDRENDAIDELTWDDLRAEIGAFDLTSRTEYPQVFLTWRWDAREVLGGNLQELTELVAPAFIAAVLAAEETLRPFGRPHPLIGAVRAGLDLARDLEGYPTGWDPDSADPVEVIERGLMRALVTDPTVPEARAAVLAAHGTEWRRLPGIGVAGVVELMDGPR